MDSIAFYGRMAVAEVRRHGPRPGADVGGEKPKYAHDDFLSAAKEEMEGELRGVISKMQEIAKQPITPEELWIMVEEIGKEEARGGKKHSARKNTDIKGAQYERVAEKIEETITDLCQEFVWDPALYYNRDDVKEMIRGALGKAGR